ncbi:hypothetical protein M409DRAFT_18725 [Zasmidium cellare ATCC 36951]|uniref:CENP-V/GFA domain-containing protein n=1 Tax=Zasmidium cellare ATCC 36951 TaxID=1080233 RepID=A0A6A6CVL5_ZASCE|nr:uncharacterized protein M409DRAFT_18725 [Zasmidium cellare ATCC 36951]KAF2170753.1 hypothetical protein M409DRAFT_18725 [Zasmidium cellare ATCC 36951]
MSSSDAPAEAPFPLEETGAWGHYDLHCHCGAVRYTMKMSPPLFEEESQGKGVWKVNECDCSWCERNGSLAVHPLEENVTWTRGVEHLSKYSFGNKNVEHLFCSKCGSFVGSDSGAMFKKMGSAPRTVVNVRMLKDFDRKKLTIKRVEFMKQMPPKYSIDD